MLIQLIKKLDIQIESSPSSIDKLSDIKYWSLKTSLPHSKRYVSIAFMQPGIITINSDGVLKINGGLILLNNKEGDQGLIDAYFEGEKAYEEYVERKLLIDDVEESIYNVKKSPKS